MAPSAIPHDLLTAIENTLGDLEYATYVLDGQSADTPGGDDDWHDVLVLIVDDAAVLPSREQVVKFTRRPDGIIEYYHPQAPHAVLHVLEPAGGTDG